MDGLGTASGFDSPMDENGWLPIETAPKDGTLIDVWCPWDGNERGGIRLTDVSWHAADEWTPHTGWSRITDDGDMDMVEIPPTCRFGLPPWNPSHWQPLPNPPVLKEQGE